MKEKHTDASCLAGYVKVTLSNSISPIIVCGLSPSSLVASIFVF
jgi:hypothetical protein